MYLLKSLALAGFLAFFRVGGWDRKDDYYKESECPHKQRLTRLQRSQHLKQCHSSPNPKGQKGEEDCKKYLQENYKHLCGDKNDIIYCHTGFMLCCYNNSICIKDLYSFDRWNEIMLKVKDKNKKEEKDDDEKERKGKKSKKGKRKKKQFPKKVSSQS